MLMVSGTAWLQLLHSNSMVSAEGGMVQPTVTTMLPLMLLVLLLLLACDWADRQLQH
jgi:hypothetical protein